MKTRLKSFLNRFPRIKKTLKQYWQTIWPQGVSTNYVEVSREDESGESERLKAAWQSDELPARQRALVDQQLKEYRKGATIDVFDVMVKSIRKIPSPTNKLRVLEVGCSSGYYSEVLDIAGVKVDYTGCDFSESFVAMARHFYPTLQFDQQDATALSYANNSFNVVISGCCLLHIPDYASAVAETARVTSKYAIFHRTPVLIGQANKYYRKLAYGVETIEIHFNEPQFLQLLSEHGFDILEIHTLSESTSQGIGSASRTYVCRKK